MICYPRKSTFSANTRQGYLYLSVDFNLTRRTFLPTILYSDSGCTYQCILVYNNGIRDAYRVPLPRCKFVQIIFSCPLTPSAFVNFAFGMSEYSPRTYLLTLYAAKLIMIALLGLFGESFVRAFDNPLLFIVAIGIIVVLYILSKKISEKHRLD